MGLPSPFKKRSKGADETRFNEIVWLRGIFGIFLDVLLLLLLLLLLLRLVGILQRGAEMPYSKLCRRVSNVWEILENSGVISAPLYTEESLKG
ncbi:hypothetical protein [Bacillus sp. NEAU-Y102]